MRSCSLGSQPPPRPRSSRAPNQALQAPGPPGARLRRPPGKGPPRSPGRHPRRSEAPIESRATRRSPRE
ncbi:hypothetical protein NDU88_008678 [Pleurodeles waltl]|uniref:Uncharacterized protein n=1 Tax=Pleurodeles waltl TaxID=8319 RepID=A0AAV7PXB9_PLEWA|nr:hypothetical protein NDU88_008678 [Pleurodeles waltl]